jgi:hypothetical protein
MKASTHRLSTCDMAFVVAISTFDQEACDRAALAECLASACETAYMHAPMLTCESKSLAVTHCSSASRQHGTAAGSTAAIHHLIIHSPGVEAALRPRPSVWEAAENMREESFLLLQVCLGEP